MDKCDKYDFSNPPLLDQCSRERAGAPQHDPRLDQGRAALIAQLDEQVPPKGAGTSTADALLTRTDPLDTTAELETRVTALWAEWCHIKDTYNPLVATELSKGALRTALIRAQRDAATRAISRCQDILKELRT
jgi:hypothetical protein